MVPPTKERFQKQIRHSFFFFCNYISLDSESINPHFDKTSTFRDKCQKYSCMVKANMYKFYHFRVIKGVNKHKCYFWHFMGFDRLKILLKCI